jgi:hypothetical protein
LRFCADPGCGAVVPAPTTVPLAFAPAPPSPQTAATEDALEHAPAAQPAELEGEVRPRRAQRALLVGVGVVTVVAVLAMGLSPSLWFGHPSLSVTPRDLAFDEGGGGAVLPLAFAIENGGKGRLDWQVETDAAWLTLAPTSGTLDAGLDIVTASADITALPAGTHTAVCTVAAPGARNSPRVVNVVLTVHSTVESRAIADALGDRVEVLEGIQPPYVADPMGSPIVLVNNDEASDVTLAELLEFIRGDATDESPYVQDLRMCGTFAEQLHNSAEAAGIRAAWVSLDLQGQEIGHALNAFVTTDRGLVFVDSTGDNPLAIVSPDGGRGECECDRIAYVRVGSEYGLISIDRAVDPAYDFYVAYSAAWSRTWGTCRPSMLLPPSTTRWSRAEHSSREAMRLAPPCACAPSSMPNARRWRCSAKCSDRVAGRPSVWSSRRGSTGRLTQPVSAAPSLRARARRPSGDVIGANHARHNDRLHARAGIR